MRRWFKASNSGSSRAGPALALLACIPLLAGLAPAAVGAAPLSDTTLPLGVSRDALGAPSKGVFVLSGELETAAGKKTAGRVAALLWPSEAMAAAMSDGTSFETPTVGWAKVSATGRFRLEVVPSLVPEGYVGPNGQLNLMLRAWDGRQERSWMVSTGNEVSVEDLGVRAAAPGYGTAKDAVRIRLNQKQTDGLTDVTVAKPGDISTEALPAPAYPWCSWVLNSSSDVRVVDDVPIYTWNDSARVELGASKSISVGGALSAGSKYGSFSYSGSSTKSQGADYQPTGYTTDERMYRVEMRYGQYKEVCHGGINGPYILRWAFEPIQATGGYSYQTVSYNKFPCYMGGINVPGPATWARKSSSGNTTKFSAGVKTAGLIGIDLPFEASYGESSTSDRKAVYKTTRTTMHLCGNNDDPPYASLVREGPAKP
jgi:hypothetical protein